LVLSCGGSGTFSHHICIAYQTQQKREEKKCTAVVANDKSDDDQAEQRLEQRPHVIVESSDLVGLVSLPEAPENGIEGHKAVVDKQGDPAGLASSYP
jgi:hypothetical protein